MRRRDSRIVIKRLRADQKVGQSLSRRYLDFALITSGEERPAFLRNALDTFECFYGNPMLGRSQILDFRQAS
jgi:hypothetical protein